MTQFREDRSGSTRRDMLRALGVGALAIPAMRELWAQAASEKSGNSKVNKLTAKGGAIDVHHHHQPPGLAGGGGRGGGGKGKGGGGGDKGPGNVGAARGGR